MCVEFDHDKYHIDIKTIVGNPRGILIDSLFHHPWVHLQIYMTSVTSSYPMKLRVIYACCSSVSGSTSKFCSDEIWLVYMVHAYF